MNTQDMLTRVNAAMALVPRDDRYPIPGTLYGELDALAKGLEAAIRQEMAVRKGAGNAARTITKMLNALKKHDTRESLHYAWLDEAGRQCVCDGFRAYRLNDPLPLEPRPENAGATLDLEKIIPKDLRAYAAIPMPDAKDIRAHIALEKAKHPGEKGFTPLWDFGEGRPVANAQFLLELATVFPDAAEIFVGTGTNLCGPMLVHSETGDGVLLPIRTPRVTAELAAARAEAEDERKAFDAALTERVAAIRAAMATQENYAMEPGEFVELVQLMDSAKAA